MDERVVEFMKLITPRIVANGGIFIELETENLDEKHWANVSQLLHMFKEDLPQTKIHVQCSTFVLLPGMDMDPMDTWPSPALGVRGLHFSKKSKQIAKKAFSLKFFGLIRGDGCSVQPP
jgi:hypothetical protein